MSSMTLQTLLDKLETMRDKVDGDLGKALEFANLLRK